MSNINYGQIVRIQLIIPDSDKNNMKKVIFFSMLLFLIIIY